MTDIAGATGSTYTLVTADIGQNITCKVTATNIAGSANVISAAVGPVTAAGGGGLTAGFFPLKIGGGGYVTGLRLSGDGLTRIIRTDTYGAYRWNSSTSYWDCTNMVGRMPAFDISIDSSPAGCYELAIAPSNSNIVYMYTYWMHKSTDGGRTFVQQAGFTALWSDPNAQSGIRMTGPKMAVHPTNPNTVYLMTQSNGLYYTTNGGTSWTKEATIPDPVSGRAGTVTFNATGSVIFVSSAGHGLYKGTSGGAFTSISGGPGTSATFMHVKMANNGTLFISGQNWVAAFLWRYVDGSPGTWTSMAVPTLGQSVVCDPNNVDRVLYGDSGGGWMTSLNANAVTPAWSSAITNANKIRVAAASEAGWLTTCNEVFMSEGDAQFDPVIANRLWFVEGIGVWYADIGTGAPSTITYNSQNKGVEGMVTTQVRATPSGALVMSQWDRAVFKLDSAHPDVYPTTQILDLGDSINHGWFIDWAASDPTFLVANLAKIHPTIGACYSTNSGSAWTEFPKTPLDFGAINLQGSLAGGCGGSIVAATDQKILWQPQWDHDLWYSADRGTTWTKQNLTSFGVPLDNGTVEGTSGTNETGWGHASAQGGVRHQCICVDRATPGIFYAYNCGGDLGASSYAGLYKLDARTTPTWTRPFSGLMSTYVYDAWNCHIEAVPKLTSVDTTGHIFYTTGQAGGTNPAAGALFRFSRNGGTTWTSVPNVLEVYAFGFGKEAAGKDYPTLFIAGFVNVASTWTWGIWKAEANDANWAANSVTWTNCTTYPYNWADWINTMDGDKLIRGRVYFGFGGSSYGYGNT